MIFERGHFNKSKVQTSVINESLTQVRTFSSTSISSTDVTVFLSHKHADLEDLRGVMGTLKDLGAKVYIDSMDNMMPYQTCGDTAVRIKEIIKSTKKFILLATDKAIESFWCNWELGIGDTSKYIDHIAILPMKENGDGDNEYKGNEYLQIYPRIDYRDGTTRYSNQKLIPKGYYVCNPLDTNNKRRKHFY